MCTITFAPQGGAGDELGYLLAMNRDEQLTRIQAFPPALFPQSTRTSLYPYEPSGGTWIGINSAGLCFALFNSYQAAPSQGEDVARKRSRGEIIPLLLQATDLAEAFRKLTSEYLQAFSPFRLLALDRSFQVLQQGSFEGGEFQKIEHPWVRRHFFSSSLDEAAAARHRLRIFERASGVKEVGTAAWVRKLHQSHEGGELAICLHRFAVATVSYSELRVSSRGAQMRYQPGSPCEQRPAASLFLSFNSPAENVIS